MNHKLLRKHINLDKRHSLKLSRQLYIQLQNLILNGQIVYKSYLPTTRALATSLSISRGAVVEAYEMLQGDNLVIGLGKLGTQVIYHQQQNNQYKTQNKASIPLSTRGHIICKSRRYEDSYSIPPLTPSVPDYRLFAKKAWNKLSRDAIDTAPIWYCRQGGVPLLLEMIAKYLAQYRGISRSKSHQLFITNGTQASLSLLANLLADPGDTAALESPGWPGALAAIKQAQLKEIYIPVDQEGARITSLQNNAKPPKIIILTPSLQFPSGVIMGINRRDAFLQYAADHHCWIIEDDFAAEYTYKQYPSASLLSHQLAANVIHLGTMSKILFPGLRIGWMLVPNNIAAQVQNAINIFGLQPPYMLQQQLGLFIQAGYLNTHLAQTRLEYTNRKKHCCDMLASMLGSTQNQSPSLSGMNHAIKLGKLAKKELSSINADIKKENLGCEIYYHPFQKSSYLLLGHCALDPDEMEPYLRKLVSIIR